MGLRNTIIKALQPKEKTYQLGTPYTGGGLQFFEMQSPPGWGYQSYLKAYGEIGTLFACVNVIAQAVAKVPWHLFELEKQGEKTEVFEHPLIDLLNTFNPFQSRYQFMYLGTMYKLLVGEEFWQMNMRGSQPEEIWLAPPAFMSVVPSATKYISHYEFKRTGMDRPIMFTVEEIIHIKTPNPYNEYRGLSPAQALTVDLDTERYAARFNQKFFFNDATPGFMLEFPPDQLPPMETRKELMQEWDERYKGFRNRGKPAFLWGAKANVVTLSQKDMDFANLRLRGRDAIMEAYHVPRSKLGITENVNRANAEQGDYDFAQNCVHPELCELRESMNKELCPLFGDNLYLDFENPIPEDKTLEVNRAVNLYKASIITRNEARELVDLEPVEGEEGEEFFTQPMPMGLEENKPPEELLGEKPKMLLGASDPKGGEGSGNFGHQGRPGEVGGSGEGGGSPVSTPQTSDNPRVIAARASYRPATLQAQRQGEANEVKLATEIKGKQTPDNEAFDVVSNGHCVEVKTIVAGANDKITMHPESLARKVAYASSNRLTAHTVVFDGRNNSIYYRRGIGSFRLRNMERVPSLSALRGKFN